MDFSNFTNINARITAWGGIKQTAFNKKKYAAAEASWNLLSPQEIAMLDQQIPYGVEAFSFVATPDEFYSDKQISYLISARTRWWNLFTWPDHNRWFLQESAA